MKNAGKIAWTTAALSLAIVAMNFGCVYQEPPPPPGPAVVGYAPDYCFWDGYEYVGWFGGGYYYWGPRHVWVVCDPVRVQRVNAWVAAHHDLHKRPTVGPVPHRVEHPPHPPRQPQDGHDHDHDQDN